ncbi:MAG: cysteine dioxygenase family protein [Bdellovibrionales bacterium]|nr:cysteine dioxygenase family protein [Bdellovibrionales bacterium]
MESLETFISRLDECVEQEGTSNIVRAVKCALEDAVRNKLNLPEKFYKPCGEKYARRLLHKDSQGRYSVVVMVWDQGQVAPLHDHDGKWCVEAVIQGKLLVRMYDLLGRDESGLYSFKPKSEQVAEIGEAGCLIPPSEYHTMAHAGGPLTLVTLHVYASELEEMTIFRPEQDGRFREEKCKACYSDDL